jgi:hypothetical protein
MSLNCGARGTRTPGPLLANRRQHVHRRPSPQLTVLGRAPGSVRIRAGCCTFLLYSLAGSAAVQERCSTACGVSRFPPSAACDDRRPEVACRGVDLTLLCRRQCASSRRLADAYGDGRIMTSRARPVARARQHALLVRQQNRWPVNGHEEIRVGGQVISWLAVTGNRGGWPADLRGVVGARQPPRFRPGPG